MNRKTRVCLYNSIKSLKTFFEESNINFMKGTKKKVNLSLRSNSSSLCFLSCNNSRIYFLPILPSDTRRWSTVTTPFARTDTYDCDIPNQITALHNELSSISLTMGVNGARNAVRNFDIQLWNNIFYKMLP